MANMDTKERDARQCITDIFRNPPVSKADLKTRLNRVDSTTVRRLLIDDLDKRKIAESEGFIFVEAVLLLGPGGQRKRLLKIASDQNRDKEARAFAFMALGHDSFDDGDLALAEIGAELIDEMMSFSLRNLFMMEEGEIGSAVLNSLEGMNISGLAMHFWPILEEQRTKARVPAYIAYEHTIQSDSFSDLHQEMIAAIEKEGHYQGITLLETLSSRTKDRSVQKGFQKAALKARTRMADPEMIEEAENGFALASSCDGQGSIVVLACLNNENGSLSLANVCLRVDSEIRDGFYLSSISKDDFDDIVEQSQVGANIDFVRLSIGEAANVLHKAMEQNRKKNIPIDLDAQRAIACFPHRSDPLLYDPSSLPIDAGVHTVEDYEELLDSPEYESWFFDAADFEQAGVIAPDDCHNDWIDETASKLDTPAIKERLLAMTSYMAWWCSKNGNEESAAMQLEANKSVVEDFKNSVFVKAMVIQSFFAAHSREDFDDEENVLTLGDPKLRRYLQGMFFADEKAPTGREMALLDFTEAAYLAFDEIFESLPGDMHPRPNILPAISFEVAKIVGSTLLKKQADSTEQIIAKAARAIKKTTGLGKAHSQGIANMVISILFDFADNVCKKCRVACLFHPKKKMPEVFFGAGHPSIL